MLQKLKKNNFFKRYEWNSKYL